MLIRYICLYLIIFSNNNHNNDFSDDISFKRLGGMISILANMGYRLKNYILKILFAQLDVKIAKTWC
jgi:hypothetical protein